MHKTLKAIGLLGGTFDPIHNGHLAIAELAYSQLHLTQVQFIPCKTPSHRKQPGATWQQRLAMLQLALQHHPHFIINDIELYRPGFSYTIDTLRTFKAQQPDQSFYLLVGADVYQSFDRWLHWQSILQYCHIIRIFRADRHDALNPYLKKWTQRYLTNQISDLTQVDHGLIYTLNIEEIQIAASWVRRHIANTEKIRPYLPPAVFDYVMEHRLYDAKNH